MSHSMVIALHHGIFFIAELRVHDICVIAEIIHESAALTLSVGEVIRHSPVHFVVSSVFQKCECELGVLFRVDRSSSHGLISKFGSVPVGSLGTSPTTVLETDTLDCWTSIVLSSDF